MSKPYRINNIGFLILIFSLMISCGEKKGKVQESKASEFLVDAVKIIPQDFETQVKVTANLLPFEKVELKAPVSGTVLSIDVKEGQHVKEGQLIVHLDDRTWIAQEKGVKARLLSAQADLKRKQELLTMEGASQQDVDQAQAEVDAMKALIEELNVKINLANVSAPFDGKLGMRDFSVGSYLNQGQIITSLSQDWKLKVDFNFSSQYYDQIKEGNTVRVISNQDTVEAKIYAINPLASNTSRTLQIRAVIEKNNMNFIPGNFAEVVVPIQVDKQAIIVPSDCIIPELNAQTVFVYHSGKVFRKKVELGARTNYMVQILSGINPGDTVLTTGLMRVRDNFPVRVNQVTESTSL